MTVDVDRAKAFKAWGATPSGRLPARLKDRAIADLADAVLTLARERDEARQQVAEARAERDAAFEDLEAAEQRAAEYERAAVVSAEQQVAALREALDTRPGRGASLRLWEWWSERVRRVERAFAATEEQAE